MLKTFNPFDTLSKNTNIVPSAGGNAFTFKIDTTESGITASSSFRLPTVSDGEYAAVVEWGDGTRTNLTVWNQTDRTHVYPVDGVYIIKITGKFKGWRMLNGDAAKLIDVMKWGILEFVEKVSDRAAFFMQCSNLVISATDIPNMSGITNVSQMFDECTSLVSIPGLKNWTCWPNIVRADGMFWGSTLWNGNVDGIIRSSCEDISNMFTDCPAFDQDISSWDFSSVAFMDEFLLNGGLSTANYNAFLIAASQQTLQEGILCDMGSSVADGDGLTAKDDIINNYSWTITDGN